MTPSPAKLPPGLRADWLCELAAALEQARALLTAMDLPGQGGSELPDLHLRIEAARQSVRSLQLSGSLTGWTGTGSETD